MEKRYQVFISSTFQDLQNARQEVSQALLRADCFPAGMELFPAADEEQFEFIKTVIDQSDYYIIISAGRYGSIHPKTRLSYTEMEYDYAVETGKPVIRLLHKDPFKELKGEFIEQTDRARAALQKFRDKLSGETLVRFWSEPKELGTEVLLSLTFLIKRRPAIGWIRRDGLAEAGVVSSNSEDAIGNTSTTDDGSENEQETDEFFEYPEPPVDVEGLKTFKVLSANRFNKVRLSQLISRIQISEGRINALDLNSAISYFGLTDFDREIVTESLEFDLIIEHMSIPAFLGMSKKHFYVFTDTGYEFFDWAVEYERLFKINHM